MQVQILIVFLSVALSGSSALVPRAAGLGPALGLAIGVQLALVLLAVLGVRAATRRYDRTGNLRPLVSSRLVGTLSWVSLGAHIAAVWLTGWTAIVRTFVGDLILVDELLICLPALLAMVGLMAVNYPIEVRLHEAAVVARIDAGDEWEGGLSVVGDPEGIVGLEDAGPLPIAPLGRWLWLRLRHGPLLVLLPLLATFAWGELVPRLLGWLTGAAGNLKEGTLAEVADFALAPERAESLRLGLELAGIVSVVVLSPLVVPLLWDAKELRHGELADELTKLCRSCGVRFRRLLVWRTGGTVLNGAVVGVVAPLRYVLLTDALIGALPRPQLRAVMLHEIAHAAEHHLLWLTGAMMSGAMFGGAATTMLVFALRWLNVPTAGLVGLAVPVGSVLGGVLMLGVVSRRFEWQADAFAAKFLSRQAARPGPEEVSVIEDAGTSPMIGALSTVAKLNCIPKARWSFRHGSIDERIERLRHLRGVPVAQIPVDRAVRRIKWAIAVMMILLAGFLVASFVWPTEDPSLEPEFVRSLETAPSTGAQEE